MDPNESRVWNVKSIKWKSAAKKKKRKKEGGVGQRERYVSTYR